MSIRNGIGMKKISVIFVSKFINSSLRVIG